MDFGSINIVSVVLATVAAYIIGAVYYTVLSKPWMKATRIDPVANKMRYSPFVISFIGELFLAVILYLVLDDITFAGSFSEEFDMASSVIWSVIFWAGFIVTTLTINHRYEGFSWALTIIDAVHWLLVFAVMGAIIGWFGLPETSLLNGALTI